MSWKRRQDNDVEIVLRQQSRESGSLMLASMDMFRNLSNANIRPNKKEAEHYDIWSVVEEELAQ